MNTLNKKRAVQIIVVGLIGIVAWFVWQRFQPAGLPPGFASSNGRIEAVEIDVAGRTSGRIDDILVEEGDFVATGEVLARMDTAVLDAQRREAEAQLQRARIGIETARSLVKQRQAELYAAQAVVRQREAEREVAQKQLARTQELVKKGTATLQGLDEDRARHEGAKAAVSTAQAQVAAAEAAHGAARSQVIGAEAAVEAASATLQRIQADIDDSLLKAPREGRVQYRVAQPGEVIAAGGSVLNLVDLSDVYMTFFLPTQQAGRVALGAEARIVLDPAPQYVIPASISFVSDVAQFTPKTVETAEERQKLMFRLKARIEPELLRRYLHQVKTGLPGMAYVRLDPQAQWPADLHINLPQ